MNNEERFEKIVMHMYSGGDEGTKDDRTIEKMIKKNKLPLQFLQKFDLDFLEFFIDAYFNNPNAIKPSMFMEAIAFQSTPIDDIYYENIKKNRTYVK